jgi:hypothetical protein
MAKLTKAPKKLGAQNVRLDLSSLFRARYERVRASYGAVTDTEGKVEAVAGDPGARFARDLFGGLYDPSMTVDDSTSDDPLRRVLDWATGELEKLPEWRSIASTSKNNVIASSLATEAVVEHLAALEWPAIEAGPSGDKLVRDNAGREEELEVWTDGATLHKRTTVGGKSSTTSRALGSPAAAQRACDQAKRNAQQAGYVQQAGAGSYDDALEQFAASLETGAANASFRAASAASLKQAAQDAADAEAVIGLAYGTEGTSTQLADPDPEAARLAAEIRKNSRMAEFLRRIGQFMEAIQQSSARQRVHGHVMPYDIGTTRDFRRLVPSELALLALPQTRANQTVRVVAGKALGWQMTDIAPKSIGPFHVAVDMSGSMDPVEIEAKAFAVAAVLSAADQGRDVTMCIFDTEVKPIAGDLDSPQGRAKFIGDVLKARAGGGTNFKPLVKHIERLGAGVDVLLISDGQGAIDEQHTRQVFSSRALHYLVLGYENGVDPLLKELAGSRMLLAQSLLDGGVAEFAASAAVVV